MFCKDTLMMIAGGLITGYGAARAMGEKNSIKKLDVIGPLIGGAAILGYGYMSYSKNKMPSSPPAPPVPHVKGVTSMNDSVMDNTPKPIPNPAPRRMWANYTESNTLNASGNASSLYDYNHIYPGFI